jgi:hypothetical protein
MAEWEFPESLVRQSDHQAWRLARAGKVTASVFRRVVEAKTPRALRTLAREITEDLAAVQRQELTTKLDDVPAIRWGRENEAEARALYTLETGNDVADGGFHVWPRHQLVGASPDGLIGTDGILEIKCPFNREQHHTYGNGPGNAVWQVQGQLLCTGRAWADFVSFDPRERPELQLFITRVERDDVLLEGMADRLVMFADEFLAPALAFAEAA